MNTPRRSVWTVLGATILALACYVPLSATPVGAQSGSIMQAADRINGLTPRLMPQQTIFVGTYAASPPRTFTWNLQQVAEYYPNPNLPDYKKEEYGGPAQLWHSTLITSYRVTYQFKVINKPAYFSLSLSTPDANGQMVEKQATWNGDIASVTFNPGRSSPPQNVHFRVSGTPVGGLVIRPRIAPEVGAFMVPRLLLTVIYEPPGAQSWAKYGVSSTAGSTFCWGFTRTGGGVVQTVMENTFVDSIDKAGTALKALMSAASVVTGGTNPYIEAAKGVGDVLSNFNEVIGNTQIQTTSVRSYTKSDCQGAALTLDKWYDTDPADAKNYPGQGDIFVILEDVLFVYAFVDGRVALSPKGYRWARKLYSSQLDGYLPPALAAQYRQLNPWLNPSIIPAGQPATAAAPRTSPLVTGPKLSAVFGGPRFIPRPPIPCDIGGGEGTGEAKETFSSSTVAGATTTTVVTKVSGLMAEFMGSAGESSQSITYSRSKTDWVVDAQYAQLYLNCDMNEGAFAVDRYFDTLLGTFFTVKGSPIYYIAGIVTDGPGRPAPSQTVTLKMGGQHYTAVSNRKGEFRFRLTSLPASSGSVGAGTSVVPVSYTGRPVTGLRVVMGAASTTPPVAGQPGVPPKTGAPRPGSTGSVAVLSPPPGHCCTIASVDMRSGVVTAQPNASGQAVRFTAPPSLLRNFKAGQKVWIDSRTQVVSVEGAPNCCKLAPPPPATTAPVGPVRVPGARN